MKTQFALNLKGTMPISTLNTHSTFMFTSVQEELAKYLIEI